MVYEFDGTKHGKLRDMQAARRAKHPDLARGGTDFTQAAHAAGTPKHTGKAWRNGRTQSEPPARPKESLCSTFQPRTGIWSIRTSTPPAGNTR